MTDYSMLADYDRYALTSDDIEYTDGYTYSGGNYCRGGVCKLTLEELEALGNIWEGDDLEDDLVF